MKKEKCKNWRNGIEEIRRLNDKLRLEIPEAERKRDLEKANTVMKDIEEKFQLFFEEDVFVNIFPKTKNYLSEKLSEEITEEESPRSREEVFGKIKELAKENNIPIRLLRIEKEIFDAYGNFIYSNVVVEYEKERRDEYISGFCFMSKGYYREYGSTSVSTIIKEYYYKGEHSFASTEFDFEEGKWIKWEKSD